MLFKKKIEQQANSENKAVANKVKKIKTEDSAFRTPLRSLLMAGICLLSLVTVVLGIEAWFVFNQEVSATGMQVKAKDNIHIESYTVYKHIQPTTYGQDGETDAGYVSFGQDAEVSFNKYDALWEQTDSALYIRLVLKSEEFASEKFAGLKIEIPCDDNAVWSSSSDTDSTKYLSSIVQMNCAAFTSEVEEEGQTLEGYYKALKTQFGTLESGGTPAQTFVTIESGNPQYNADKKLTYTISKDGLNRDNNNQIILYFKIDYDEALVKKFIGNITETSTLPNINTTNVNLDNFTKDIESILINIQYSN